MVSSRMSEVHDLDRMKHMDIPGPLPLAGI